MSLLDSLRGNLVSGMDDITEQVDVRQQLRQEQDTSLMLTERLAELEFALEDQGWQQLSQDAQFEFSHDGLVRMARLARLMWLKNPLIRRGVNVRAYYTWAEPPELNAADDRVQDVIDACMEDDGNQAEWWSHTARLETDVDSHCDGNVFVVLFTDPQSGHVSIRTVPMDEIVQIVMDPDDRLRPRFYKRTFTVEELQANGTLKQSQKTVWHPHHTYRPSNRPDRIGKAEVRWDAPILHHKAGGLKRMRMGVPETYAALDWARAHKGFLEDTSTLIRSLARLAWKVSGKRAGKAAKQLGSTLSLDQAEGNPVPAAGSVAGVPEGSDLTPIPKSGATIGAEDSRYLRLQVAAALDLPDTWLSGDADQGNRATAQTLDRTTELMFESRRERWTQVDRELVGYLLRARVKAPAGGLTGNVRVVGDREMLDVGWDPKVEHDWSPLVEHSTKDRVDAIVTAATLGGHGPAGTIPTEALSRELLVTLGFEDVDSLLDDIAAEPEVAGEFGEAVRKLAEAIEGGT